MLWIAMGLLAVGVFLSAFFSGSETGFYRASRVRIVMDALDGDRRSKFLHFLTNRPALFVATALTGNNLANYLTSLAVVLGARSLYPSDTAAAELVAPILMSPLLYVYGESLPKNIFFLAPNQLLKLGAPLLLVCFVLFVPVALLLFGVAKILEYWFGTAPDRVRLGLARQEVKQMIAEGERAGILHPTQRHLAQAFFVEASKPAGSVCTTISRFQSVSVDEPVGKLVRYADRKITQDLLVWENSKSNIVGYYLRAELLLASKENPPTLHRIATVQSKELAGEVLLQMRAARESLRKVTNERGDTVGILSLKRLTNMTLHGPLTGLRR